MFGGFPTWTLAVAILSASLIVPVTATGSSDGREWRPTATTIIDIKAMTVAQGSKLVTWDYLIPAPSKCFCRLHCWTSRRCYAVTASQVEGGYLCSVSLRSDVTTKEALLKADSLDTITFLKLDPPCASPFTYGFAGCVWVSFELTSVNDAGSLCAKNDATLADSKNLEDLDALLAYLDINGHTNSYWIRGENGSKCYKMYPNPANGNAYEVVEVSCVVEPHGVVCIKV